MIIDERAMGRFIVTMTIDATTTPAHRYDRNEIERNIRKHT